MAIPIIGLCRFSFLGRGDWQAWRGVAGTGDADQRRAMADRLYRPERMEERFWTLEHLLLPSIRAQTDPAFHLVILTSQAMPQVFRDRLRDLVAGIPQVRLEISDADNVNDGLFPALDRLRGEASATVQFRIDDDDCLATDYVARLADFSRRMEGFGPWSYSRPRGLMVTAYRGDGLRHFSMDQPFHSIGTATCLMKARWTVFSMGHFALQRRFPSFLDWQAPAYLALKTDGHDSLPMLAGQLPPGFAEIAPEAFSQAMAERLPFVDLQALGAWLGQDRPALAAPASEG